METQSLSAPARRFPAIVLAGLAIFMACVSIFGWVSDDAYITFRFLENFRDGYGLRWNIDERVQAYTHPLWMLLHIPLYLLWDNIFMVTIIISLACTLAALVTVLYTFERPAYITIICFILPLLLSKIFVEFSTSGLENPLSHLLFASFGYLIIKQRNHPRFWFFCSLNIALATLNRLDTIILYLPPLLWVCLPRIRTIRIDQVLFGAMPLILWFAFSLFYYGFLFPNTKYAKLSTGIASADYIKQGILYYLELFSSDAFSYMLLCVLLARLIDTTKDIFSGKVRRELEAGGNVDHYTLHSVAIGALAYMGYVTCVGGDFMSGRFLALPYFVSVWLIYASTPALDRKRAITCVIFFVALKSISVSMAHDSMARCMSNIENPYPTWGQSFCVKSGIADERAFYSPTRIWFYPGEGFNSHRIVKDRSYWLATEALKNPDDTYIFGAIGALGYYAPKVRFIDFHALTDPLLARLPIKNVHEWRIGHFERDIPDGYIFALKHNRLDQMHPALAAYYKPLRLIVTGDLLDSERLKAIIDFNLGRYDHFKEEYLRAESTITD